MPAVYGTRRPPQPSPLYPILWRLARRRQAVYLKRVANEPPPWTDDPIITRHRFTNAYRAADRVSQAMIRIIRESAGEDERTILLRILLFKFFNRIETWESLTADGELPRWQPDSLRRTRDRLDAMKAQGRTMYSAAYVMPAGAPGQPKHLWNLEIIERIVDAGTAERAAAEPDMERTFRELHEWPSIGGFLAMQLATDIHYWVGTAETESRFVVPGPGAADGLSKCFENLGDYDAADTIRWMTDRQDDELGSPDGDDPPWNDLFGRRLQPIDIQNLLCETSKYTRASNPEVQGSAGRKRIKQRFKAAGDIPKPVFPEHWGINAATDAWWKTNRRTETTGVRETAEQRGLPIE